MSDTRIVMLAGGQVIGDAHTEDKCAGGRCAIHHLTDHHLRAWPQRYRGDRGIMERTCPHGIGHPDPDDMAWREDRATQGVHGCDGCCKPDSLAEFDAHRPAQCRSTR